VIQVRTVWRGRRPASRSRHLGEWGTRPGSALYKLQQNRVIARILLLLIRHIISNSASREAGNIVAGQALKGCARPPAKNFARRPHHRTAARRTRAWSPTTGARFTIRMYGGHVFGTVLRMWGSLHISASRDCAGRQIAQFRCRPQRLPGRRNDEVIVTRRERPRGEAGSDHRTRAAKNILPRSTL